jgi:hypothetical protein
MGWISWFSRQVWYTVGVEFLRLGFIMISEAVVYFYRPARKAPAKDISENIAGELPCHG